jgi:hypothetical protein
MQAAARPYVLAAAALAATSVAVATPLALQPATPRVVSTETRLVDESLLNIPINLFDDIVNIPATEANALDTLSSALIFGDNWFAASPANLWGIDPGDPPKIEALVDLLVPFQALSGQGAGELDWSAGLGQQLAGLAAVELPVSSGCALDGCLPFEAGAYGLPEPYPGIPDTPANITATDVAWIESVLNGQTQFPLFENFFQVPLTGTDSLTSGYVFDPSYPGYYDAGSPSAYPDGYGWLGTIAGPDGTNLLPWDNTTYTLNLVQPFENFLTSLEQTPPTTLEAFPTDNVFAEFLGALNIAFDPFAPGVPNYSDLGGFTPLCTGSCLEQPGGPEYFVQLLQQLAGANNVPLLDEWLASDRGTTFPFTYGDITPAAAAADSAASTSGTDSAANLLTALDGQDASLANLTTDLSALSTGFDTSAFSADLSSLLGGLDTSAFSADLSSLLAGLDPSAFSADLSALMAQLGTTVSTDLGINAAADLANLF